MPGARAVTGDGAAGAGRILASAHGLAVTAEQLVGALPWRHLGRQPCARRGLGLPVADGLLEPIEQRRQVPHAASLALYQPHRPALRIGSGAPKQPNGNGGFRWIPV